MKVKRKPKALEEKIKTLLRNHEKERGEKITELSVRLKRPPGFNSKEYYDINYWMK